MIKIISATYGTKDVTDIVASKVKPYGLYIRVSNDHFGDPNPGKIKTLNLTVEMNGQTDHFIYTEKDIVKLPLNQNVHRLGIFYSNNVNPKIDFCISESLNSIAKASFKKADILTCMWQHQPNNPFPEIISHYKQSSFLNQILQILQLLLTSRTDRDYEYVSFLEHDVFYAEGYFDYSDFSEDYIINNNYIGINKDGFQLNRENDLPLSQVTMNFEFAIKYFTTLLQHSIVTCKKCLEPHWSQVLQYRMKTYEAEYPNMHINHGIHFTHHFRRFNSETVDIAPYWGHKDKYSKLFN